MNFCSITSGSSGNCIYAGTGQTNLLIDAGISGKKIEAGLNSVDLKTADMDGILITHEHSDHIKGLGVLARKYHIPIYATPGTIAAMKHYTPIGKVEEELYRPIQPDQPFLVKDMEVLPFSISHDAAEPVAYRLNNGNCSVGVVTDLGVYTDYTISHLQGLDGVLLEANHDIRMLQVGSYPYYLKQRILGNRGHLSNENAGKLLCEILHDGLKNIMLGHLSQENNYAELAFETVCSEVTLGDNPYKSCDFHIQVARRDCASELIVI